MDGLESRPRWRFGVLGQLIAERDGEPVTLPAARPRTLLALLLMNPGRPMPVMRLITEMWGDARPPSAQSALHVHLSKLRRAVSPLLLSTSAGYLLEPGGYELDADRLELLLEQAGEDPSRAGELTREAMALRRGEPLCDLRVGRSLARWTLVLEDRFAQAAVMHMASELDRGATVEIIPALERLVRAHPYEERLWEQLMLAQYRSGRQTAALDAYQRVRRALAAEIGIEPGSALQSLCARILRHDPELMSSHSTLVRVAG